MKLVLPTAVALAGLLVAVSAQVDVQFPFGSVKVEKGPNGVKVDVVHPAGTVNVNKPMNGMPQVDVVHPVGRVNVGGSGRGTSSSTSSSASSGSYATGADINRIDLVAILRSALGLGNKAVDVAFPGGSVNVQKGAANIVDVAFPGGSVKVGKPAMSKRAADVEATYPGGSAISRPNAAGGKDVDVSFPGGGVQVSGGSGGRRRNNGGTRAHQRRRNSQVDVTHPAGSVNVGNKGTNNVDVQFPGGFVQLDPREPGGRRNGVVVFPFGSVRFG